MEGSVAESMDCKRDLPMADLRGGGEVAARVLKMVG
jgi:hypothetical protein